MRLLDFVIAQFDMDDNFNRWEMRLLGRGRAALRKCCSHSGAWRAAFGILNQGAGTYVLQRNENVHGV